MRGIDPQPGRPRVVILARGDSRRMGRPKGGVTVPGTDLTMLQAVAALYPPARFVRLVVTRVDLLGQYRPLLEDSGPVEWITAPAGGTTAGTLAAAMGHPALKEQPAAPVLAHPVDLPLVRPATRDALLAALDETRSLVVRPSHGGQPGHPVCFRGKALGPLLAGVGSDDQEDRSMGRLLTEKLAAGELDVVEVDDPGVVRDFDSPADLEGQP